MIGIPLFASVTNPKKGDIVFWSKDDNIIRKPWKIGVVLENNEVLLECVDQAVKVSDLQRVVIEYGEVEKLDETEISSKFFPSTITKSIPLYKNDYRRILPYIGRKVDFGVMNPDVEYGFEDGPFTPTENTAKLFDKQSTEGTWADVVEQFKMETGSSVFATHTFTQWLDKNFHPPKKK